MKTRIQTQSTESPMVIQIGFVSGFYFGLGLIVAQLLVGASNFLLAQGIYLLTR